MTLEVAVTKDVTTVSVTEDTTTVNVTPATTTIALENISIAQSSSADQIGYSASGHLEATTVQAALDEIAASPEFTAALNTKLENIEALADVTDTANVVNALSAGDNISIGADGTVSADVLGAITAGNGIDIDVNGVISVDDIAIATVQTAANEAEHLALTTQQGDVVIRTDENKSYIHNGGTAGTMADFTELATNTNGVISINGETGAVTFGKSNLSDYSANEFIDWTTSQTENIHSDNYTNTTYSAGAGIQISESNEISATGGTGGTSFNATGNLNLDDSNNLDTISNPLFDEVRFTDSSGIDSGIHIESFIGTGNLAQYGDGLGIYKRADYENPDSGDREIVGLILSNSFAIAPVISSLKGFSVGNNPVAFDVTEAPFPFSTSWLPDDYDDEVKGGDYWLGRGLRTLTRPINDDTYAVASTAFVKRAIDGVQFPFIPESTSNTRHQYVVRNEDDTFSLTDLDIRARLTQQGDNVAVGFRDLNTSFNPDNADFTLVPSGGVTLTADQDNNSLTITSNVSGLPTQTEELDGYVLATDGANASWTDLSTASLPSQTDNAGKFLTTNGTLASWAEVDAFPDQFGQDGKALITNNGEVSWGEIDALPAQDSGTYGKFLASSDSGATWASTQTTIPDQDDHSGKYLTTDGSSLSWQPINTAGSTGQISFSSTNMTTPSASQDITTDRNFVVEGDVETERLIVTAGSGQIDSRTSINLRADDGVLIDGTKILASKCLPEAFIKFTVSADVSNVTNVTAEGTTPTVTVFTENDVKYIRIVCDVTNHLNYFVDAISNQTVVSDLPKVSNIAIHESSDENGKAVITLLCTGSSNTNSGFPACRVYVKIYENFQINQDG